MSVFDWPSTTQYIHIKQYNLIIKVVWMWLIKVYLNAMSMHIIIIIVWLLPSFVCASVYSSFKHSFRY